MCAAALELVRHRMSPNATNTRLCLFKEICESFQFTEVEVQSQGEYKGKCDGKEKRVLLKNK